MTLQLLRRRFTVDEYYLMIGAGILHEDDRVELYRRGDCGDGTHWK